MIFRFIIVVLVAMGFADQALASDAQICPAHSTETPPTDWVGPDCERLHSSRVNPTDGLIWVRMERMAPETNKPVALYISGRFSSRVWINGTEIGRNGLPGPDRQSEAPGLMDAQLIVPEGSLKPGANDIVLLASAHYGVLNLARPLHRVGLFTIDPNDRYWVGTVTPIMVTLGLLLAGMVYFGGLAAIRAPRGDALILTGLCALAIGQLLSELTRALWAYAYPVHDIRLLAIAGFSAAFGLLACFYVTRRLRPKWLLAIMGCATILSLMALWLRTGFDGKSSYAMLGPLCVALFVSIWTIIQARSAEQRRRASLSAAALTAFVGSNLMAPELFLDVVFFYLLAGLLLALLVEQALDRSREAQESMRETARADRLQLLLDQLDPETLLPPLVIRSAGRVEQIPINDIASIQGADGYAEIKLTNGRAILHTKSLNALETELPSCFLKVHRSHIVNTAHVRALERDSSGTGALILESGETIPVSRRILPTVRQVLS